MEQASADVRWHLPLTRFRFGLFAGHLLPSEVEAALTGAVVALCYDAWEPNSRAVAKAPAELEIFEPHEAPIKFLAYAFIHSFNFKTGGRDCGSQNIQSTQTPVRGVVVSTRPHALHNMIGACFYFSGPDMCLPPQRGTI